MTAGLQKIFHPDQRIGFLAQSKLLNEKLATLNEALNRAQQTGDSVALVAAEKAVHTNRVLHFNALLDAVVAGTFLVLVAGVALLSLREWLLLLSRRKAPLLHESEAKWLPDYALAEAKPLRAAGAVALAVALAKELSGEAHLERAQQTVQTCECDASAHSRDSVAPEKKNAYVEMTEQRFNGVRRCC
jgi:N-acetylglucosamine kinase-like BadF-type ATPase